MKKSALMLAAASALVPFAPSIAQEAADAATATGDAPVRYEGEILVTARKRQESVLKVPVVETVLSPEIIERNQIVDIRGIVQQVSGLQIGNNVLTVGPQLSLRGVGTSSLDAGVDQSVSLNIDGLQLTQGATYGVGMFDMAQVEVLKGPQALFFGKNSPGGVIAIRTADPGRELEVIARALYGFEAQEKRGEFIFSGPMGDTFGIRIAAMMTDDNGYFFNKAVAVPGTGGATPQSDRYNAQQEYILRGTLLWQPTSDFTARLKVNNTVKEVVGGSSPLGSCPDGNGAPIGIPFINPNDNCKVDRTVYIVDVDPAAFPGVRNGGVPFMKSVTNFGTLELSYNVADKLSLTSTTAYFDTVVDGFINGVNSGAAGPTLIADNHFARTDFTEELRLESDFDSPLNFLVGGYYQDASVRNRVIVSGSQAYGFPATLVGGVNDVSIKALSAFGQLRWKPVETLEIAGGVRYTDEKRTDDAYSQASMDAPPVPITIPNPRLRAKNWSPELTVTFTPTDDLTVFGALKQGYKSGSFIMTVPPQPGQDNSFGDERVRGGEVGFKARMFDRTFSLNGAFYYYKYNDLQVGTNEVTNGVVPVIRTINAGRSKVYGVDMEAAYRPPSLDGLALRLAVNWNHARFTQFDNAPCTGGQYVSEGCNQLPIEVTNPAEIAAGYFVIEPGTGRRVRYNGQSLAGVPLPKAPSWQINGGFDYTTDLGDALKLAFGANGQYSSKFLTSLGRRADFFQSGYVKLNANVSVGAQNDAWEVALLANNLTNKFTTGNCTQFAGATGNILGSITGAESRNAAGVDELACIVEPGRQVFLRLTLRPTAF
ncbi:MAG TPA: TonB-dependent receptor [Novosphingobium sp.]|nr:TonB-dependent receptor [Novosphingobium sp.]